MPFALAAAGFRAGPDLYLTNYVQAERTETNHKPKPRGKDRPEDAFAALQSVFEWE